MKVRSVVVLEPPPNNNATKAKDEIFKLIDDENIPGNSLPPLTTCTQMLYDILKSLPPLLKQVDQEFAAIPNLYGLILNLDSNIFSLLRQISDLLPFPSPETAKHSNNSGSLICSLWDDVTKQMEEIAQAILVYIEKHEESSKSELQKWICKSLHGIVKVMRSFCKQNSNLPTENARKVLEDLQQAVFFAYELFEYGEPRVAYSAKDDALVLKLVDSK